MQRTAYIAASSALLAFAIAPVFAQQGQPNALAQPAVQGNSMGPQANRTQAAPPAAIPSNPAQRPQSSSPIPSEGPSRLPSAKAPIKRVDPIRPVAPTRVLDDQGRPVPGAVRVSPNRAIDPATGRAYPSVPPATPE